MRNVIVCTELCLSGSLDASKMLCTDDRILEETTGTANLGWIGQLLTANQADCLAHIGKRGATHRLNTFLEVSITKLEPGVLFQAVCNICDYVASFLLGLEDAVTVCKTALITCERAL